MNTIQFCGGSWCEDIHPNSYVTILSEMLNTKIVGTGLSSFGHERAIRTFQKDVDYTVFTWSEPHTLYHPKFGLNMSSCNIHKDTNNFFKVGYLFFKYLHDWEYFKDRQIRDLYWFDREILSDSQSKILHLFSCNIDYTFLNGKTINYRLDQQDIGHSNGKTIFNHLSIKDNYFLANLLQESFLQM